MKNLKLYVFIIFSLAVLSTTAGIIIKARHPSTIRAYGDLTVDFGLPWIPPNGPIFTISDFKPGDCAQRNITVTNDGNKDSQISVKGVRTGGVGYNDIFLENILDLTINNGSKDHYQGTVQNYFTQSKNENGILLDLLVKGGVKKYNFRVCFPKEANNDYQNLTVNFDLKFGTVTASFPRMTGGGKTTMADGTIVGASFELNCDPKNLPNNLEINWGKKSQNFKFHLHNLTSARCFTDFNINPGQPKKLFNTYIGQGAGTLNDKTGVSAWWTFTDAGEPGRNDTLKIIINDKSGNPILNLNSPLSLSSGNFQAH